MSETAAPKASVEYDLSTASDFPRFTSAASPAPMTRSVVVPIPASREPMSLLAVQRAVGDLRRGRPVAIAGHDGRSLLALAAEAATPESLALLADAARSPTRIAVTGRRAAVLGLATAGLRVVTIDASAPLTAEAVAALSDPMSLESPPPRSALTLGEAPAFACASAAVLLAKTARLLPAAVFADIADAADDDLTVWANRHSFLLVDAGDIFQYDHTAARTLRRVSEARVPLVGAENARIIAFRPLDGGLEHLALIIGQPTNPVLMRLHSECFTGDLLASLRCDCGDQLRGAIREIAAVGGGVVLYLAQEGRGIGLVNKLRAYELQDRAFDTLTANEQLGFDDDERLYLPAAQMLRQLGFTRVRLLTNNPAKVEGLVRLGVTVEERVPHSFPTNRHNERYLLTKAVKGGHLL